MAIGMANGLLTPSDQFFKDVANGESESFYLKGLYECISQSQNKE